MDWKARIDAIPYEVVDASSAPTRVHGRRIGVRVSVRDRLLPVAMLPPYVFVPFPLMTAVSIRKTSERRDEPTHIFV